MILRQPQSPLHAHLAITHALVLFMTMETWMQRHGYGTFLHADGTKYEGEWANGRKEGKGTISFPNGDTFTGYWSDGVISGPGVFSFGSDSPWNIPDL